jgi:hypothetical protein
MSDRSSNTTRVLGDGARGGSFGLGLAELVAPGKVAAMVGPRAGRQDELWS